MSRSGSSEQDANFLGRWARRKAQSKSGKQTDKQTEQTPSAPESTVASENPEPVADRELPPVPPIESLEDDSDYSRFMAKDVGQDLRRLALRRLFKAPAYSIRDGLDDYDEDFTTFQALGTTVTADMKFHKERLEIEAAKQQDEHEQRIVARADAPQDQNQKNESPGAVEDASDEDSDIPNETWKADIEHRQSLTNKPRQAEIAVWELPAQRQPESSPPVLAPRRQRLRLRIDDAHDDAQES